MLVDKVQLESAIEFIANHNSYIRKRFETHHFETELPIPTVNEKALRLELRKSVIRMMRRLESEENIDWVASSGFLVMADREDGMIEVYVDPNVGSASHPDDMVGLLNL